MEIGINWKGSELAVQLHKPRKPSYYTLIHISKGKLHKEATKCSLTHISIPDSY